MNETQARTTAQIAVLGMGVMGRNLAMNFADKGFATAVWNRSPGALAEAVALSGGRLVGAPTLDAIAAALPRPRRILLMVPAGPAVDELVAQLRPRLEPGDVVIDAGNSWFEDTIRRERELTAAGLRFLGMGVSGGEEGARHGPSLMPGGDAGAYAELRPMLERIAARSASGACVTRCGPDGAGHFVKMVHNGIEYADMQLIAEAFHLLRAAAGLSFERCADAFARWNAGPLESFLIELTAKVLAVADPRTGAPLVSKVLDKAGQKGTGQWTVRAALELGVPVPSIAAALDARSLSSRKELRLRAATILPAPAAAAEDPGLALRLEQALLAAKILAYAQGLALIRAASERHGWGVDLAEIARVWTGGCIIRARLLGTIREAYARAPALESLLFADALRGPLAAGAIDLREVVAAAARRGLPAPAFGASLAYYDGLRTAELPHGLTQAQRDAFGAHTYQRNDEPDPPFVHTDWLAGA